jgi:hypothetical protein
LELRAKRGRLGREIFSQPESLAIFSFSKTGPVLLHRIAIVRPADEPLVCTPWQLDLIFANEGPNVNHENGADCHPK